MAIVYGGAPALTVQLEGPFGSVGSAVKLTQIHLPAANWKGAVSPFSQVVAVEGISTGSRIDLLPSAAQLELLRAGGTALLAGNEEGTVTVYALGAKPVEDMTVAATILEVIA